MEDCFADWEDEILESLDKDKDKDGDYAQCFVEIEEDENYKNKILGRFEKLEAGFEGYEFAGTYASHIVPSVLSDSAVTLPLLHRSG